MSNQEKLKQLRKKLAGLETQWWQWEEEEKRSGQSGKYALTLDAVGQEIGDLLAEIRKLESQQRIAAKEVSIL